MKKFLIKILLLIFGGGVALAAPVIPQDMKWYVSYETMAFDTKDGDLGINQYAKDFEDEGVYWIRTLPKNKGGIVSTTSLSALEGKKEVAIRAIKSDSNPNCDGCAYYSEFINKDGEIVREQYEGRYKDLKEVKGAPQPKKNEFKSVLDPGESGAAGAYDSGSEVANQNGSSGFSWSHTVTGSDRLLHVNVHSDADETITGVTFNSDAMTAGETAINTAEVATFYMVAPDTGGSYSITVTTSSGNYAGNAVSFTGIDQSDPFDTTGEVTTTGTSLSTTISVEDGSMVADGAVIKDSTTLTESGDGDVRQGGLLNFSTSLGRASTYGPKSGAGNVTMTYTKTGGFSAAQVVNAYNDLNVFAVQTDAATLVTPTTARLNGNLTANIADDVTQHGFEWSTNASLASGVATTSLGSKSGTGAFTSDLTSLTPETTYYFRAYASSTSLGILRGSILSFTALCDYYSARCTFVYSTPGTTNYTPYVDVDTALVACWGGGGGGGIISGSGGGGGGGGAFASSSVAVTFGTNYVVRVGVGGTADTAAGGGDSSFATTTVVADGGLGTTGATGAAGGTVANSTGSVEFAGGTGGTGNTTGDVGGGGGGSAGPHGAGGNGAAGTSGTVGGGGGGGNGGSAGSGSTGGSSTNGGAGGTGDSNGSANPTGGAGTTNTNGGGGGGGGDDGDPGGAAGSVGAGSGGGEIAGAGNGANGRCEVTFQGTASSPATPRAGSEWWF